MCVCVRVFLCSAATEPVVADGVRSGGEEAAAERAYRERRRDESLAPAAVDQAALLPHLLVLPQRLARRDARLVRHVGYTPLRRPVIYTRATLC